MHHQLGWGQKGEPYHCLPLSAGDTQRGSERQELGIWKKSKKAELRRERRRKKQPLNLQARKGVPERPLITLMFAHFFISPGGPSASSLSSCVFLASLATPRSPLGPSWLQSNSGPAHAPHIAESCRIFMHDRNCSINFPCRNTVVLTDALWIRHYYLHWTENELINLNCSEILDHYPIWLPFL